MEPAISLGRPTGEPWVAEPCMHVASKQIPDTATMYFVDFDGTKCMVKLYECPECHQRELKCIRGAGHRV